MRAQRGQLYRRLSQNPRPNQLSQPWADQAKSQFEAQQHKQRLFTELHYKAGSWKRQRRVILKAEHMSQGSNPRYVVANLTGDPQHLYEKVYCARGKMENRIKGQQLDLFSDRTSCSLWWPNQFRLLLSRPAYTLMAAIRRIALHNTELAHATCGTIRLKRFKVGAVVILNTRRVRLLLAAVILVKRCFNRPAKSYALIDPMGCCARHVKEWG